MEATFQDKTGVTGDINEQDAQRRLDNAAKANKGEAQEGGSAGRAQVADADPKGEFCAGRSLERRLLGCLPNGLNHHHHH